MDGGPDPVVVVVGWISEANHGLSHRTADPIANVVEEEEEEEEPVGYCGIQDSVK